MSKEYKRKHCPWTQEEMQYLEDNWGTKNLNSMAAHLGRTKSALQTKAQRLKLGAYMESGDYITMYNLMIAIYNDRNSVSGHTTELWRSRGLQIKKRNVIDSKVQCIRIKEFWEWAFRNQSILDFSKMEENILGKEPEWVKKKRKADILENRLRKKSEWTQDEIEKLRRMVKKNASMYEMQKEIKRTACAITEKLRAEGIGKTRKLHKKWSKEEKEKVYQMILDCYGYTAISMEIGRSEKSIRGMLYVNIGTEDIDIVRERLWLKENGVKGAV